VVKVKPFYMAILWLGLSPFRADALKEDMRRGDWLLYSQRYEEAIALWKRALERSPDDVDLLLRLGVALSLQERYAEAEATLEHALRIEPENPKVMYNLGLLYLRQGRDERALKYLRRTLDLVRWYPGANYHIGLLYERKGLKDKALQFYVQEVNNNPACAGAWERIFALKERNSPERKAEIPTWAVVLMFGAALVLYRLGIRRRED